MTLTDEHKAKLFDALQADGVDNWGGYQEQNYQDAMLEIESEQMFEENKKKLEPLFDIINEYETLDVEEPSERGAGYGWNLTEHGERQIINFISKNFEPK
jgi:hypothetical protein